MCRETATASDCSMFMLYNDDGNIDWLQFAFTLHVLYFLLHSVTTPIIQFIIESSLSPFVCDYCYYCSFPGVSVIR